MLRDKCKKCDYYDESYCYRYPPSVEVAKVKRAGGKGSFSINFETMPFVNRGHWCGEFKKRRAT